MKQSLDHGARAMERMPDNGPPSAVHIVPDDRENAVREWSIPPCAQPRNEKGDTYKMCSAQNSAQGSEQKRGRNVGEGAYTMLWCGNDALATGSISLRKICTAMLEHGTGV